LVGHDDLLELTEIGDRRSARGALLVARDEGCEEQRNEEESEEFDREHDITLD
jgi:hypothetical protein